MVLQKQIIETVPNFKYLGVRLNYDASWKHQIKSAELSGKKATRALSPFFHKFSALKLSFFLKIFDASVVPAILYGSEIWGAYDVRFSDNLNRPANMFYRMILGLPQSSPVAGLHLELKRLRIHELATIRSISYWLRLSNTNENRLLSKAFHMQVQWANSGASCWGKGIKDAVDKLGFSYVWS